jgi:hypothetical protein
MRAYRGGHGGLFDLLRGQFGLGWYKHDRVFGLGLACAVHNQLQCPQAGVGAGEQRRRDLMAGFHPLRGEAHDLWPCFPDMREAHSERGGTVHPSDS